jgi:hypothetical protein
MNDWVIAEWEDEEGRVRAPSFQGKNGNWYRAGVSDYGGPTILMMEGEPLEITKIQGASPQRRPADYELKEELRQMRMRQEAIHDSVAHLAAIVAASFNRIERDLARVAPAPASQAAWLGAPAVTTPVLAPHPQGFTSAPYDPPLPAVRMTHAQASTGSGTAGSIAVAKAT